MRLQAQAADYCRNQSHNQADRWHYTLRMSNQPGRQATEHPPSPILPSITVQDQPEWWGPRTLIAFTSNLPYKSTSACDPTLILFLTQRLRSLPAWFDLPFEAPHILSHLSWAFADLAISVCGKWIPSAPTCFRVHKDRLGLPALPMTVM